MERRLDWALYKLLRGRHKTSKTLLHCIQENCFLSLESFRNKFNIQCNFLQYFALVSSISSAWKKLLLVETQHTTVTEPFSNKMLTCKTLYDKLVTLEKLPPPSAEKRLENYGLKQEDYCKVYLLPFKATKEVKLVMFQYKILHHNQTNSLLYKLKKVPSPNCPFCPSVGQTIHHLFVDCSQASTFSCKFQN